MTSELIRGAARSLLQTRLRSFLTLAGIAIGIAALFSLLSIAEGIRTRIVNEWLSSGLMTSLAVMPQGAPNPLRQGGRGGRMPRSAVAPKPGAATHTLDDAAAAAIAKIAGVRRVWPVVSRPVTLAPLPAAGGRTASTKGAAPPTGAASATGAGSTTSATGAGTTAGASDGASPNMDTHVDPMATGTSASVGGAPPENRGSTPPPGDAGAVSTAHGAPPAAGAPDETEKVVYTTLRGMDADFFWNEDYLKMTAGAPLPKTGVGRDALLSDDALKTLGLPDAATAVGKSVLVRWREPAASGDAGAEAVPGLPFSVTERSATFRIAGVFEMRGALTLRNAGIMVTTEEAKKIRTLDAERLRALFEGNTGAGGYPGLDVYLTPGADLEGIEGKIRAMGFETLSGAEIVSRIRRSILVLQAVLGGLGAIAIAVATLGIANTLLTAVFERMREIGVMKAVGARRRDIRRQFFAEAGLIGLVGGLAGLLIGFGADHLLTIVVGQISRRQGGDDPGAIATHTPGIALGCLAFSITLSLLAGTFPAARAARLDPIATLRHE